MKFMGSKRRIVKDILPLMNLERLNYDWVEPFVGGGNMIERVDGKRFGYDIDEKVINALILIRDNLDIIPKNNSEFTEYDYQNPPPHLESFAGFAYSYGAKWKGGWRRDKSGKRDYVAEAYRNAQKQSPLIQDVEFAVKDFKDIKLTRLSLVYCDPPYKDSTKYSKQKFNHDFFWNWCRDLSHEGHIVFISEYAAPDDFVEIWRKEQVSSLTKDTGSKKALEKLFRYRY